MQKKIIIIAVISLFLDILFKQIIINNFSYEEINTIIPNFFYLTYIKNTGGAFSILSGNVYFLLLISILIFFIIFYHIYKKNSFTNLEVISYGMLIGGLFGNLLDRIIYKSVIDYIGFIFGSYYYPVFNFADMLIVCSILLLLYIEFRGEKYGTRNN